MIFFSSLLAFSGLSGAIMDMLQLARQGLDVVLISRSRDKLAKVAKEIGESFCGFYAPVTVAPCVYFKHQVKFTV